MKNLVNKKSIVNFLVLFSLLLLVPACGEEEYILYDPDGESVEEFENDFQFEGEVPDININDIPKF